jgi:hypothetical protein
VSSPRRRRLLVLAAAAAVAAAVVVVAVVRSHRNANVARNEAVLRSLPRFPSAHVVSKTSAPYYEEEGGSPAGYTTNVVYELPRHVRQRVVIDFYVRRMRGWTRHVEYAPGVDVATGEARPGAWGATFRRGAVVVGVNTDNLISPVGRRFEVGVDAAQH